MQMISRLTLMALASMATVSASAQEATDPPTDEQAAPTPSTKPSLLDIFSNIGALSQALPPPQDGYDPTKPVVGFGISKQEGGMRIDAIVPGSAAEKAGLKKGMTILRTNGVTMDGFETAEVVKILGHIEGEITFDIEGEGRYSLIKAPIPQAAE